MQRVEPTPPRLRRTGLSYASKAGEPAYPRYNRGAGEGLRPFDSLRTDPRSDWDLRREPSGALPSEAVQRRPADSGAVTVWGLFQTPSSQRSLSRPIHQVRRELPPQRVPTPSWLRLKSREGLGRRAPVMRAHAADARSWRSLGEGSTGALPGPSAHPPRVLQSVERLERSRARCVRIPSSREQLEPSDRLAVEGDIRPAEDGTDPVPRLVRKHERPSWNRHPTCRDTLSSAWYSSVGEDDPIPMLHP